MSDDAQRIALTYINLRLMASDTEAALKKLAARGEHVEFQAGILLGLTGAKYVLDGHTADETWDLLKPLVEELRKDTEAA